MSNLTSLPSSAVSVPMQSTDALFASDLHIQTPVPAPLLLFNCIRFPLNSYYRTDEEGLIRDRKYRFQQNTIDFADGSRFTAMVNGSEKFGLPTAFDVDYFLAVLRIVDEEGHDEDGSIAEVTFAKINRSRNPTTQGGGDATNDVKRALQRFGNTTITANFHQVLDVDGQAAVNDEEKVKWILEYDRGSLRYGADQFDVIRGLKVNPFWLRSSAERFSSWIDVDLHNSLTSPIAKSVYLRLTLADAQSQLDQYRELPLEAWEEILQSGKGDKKVERAKRIHAALEALREVGVLGKTGNSRHGRGAYVLTLEPGPVLNGHRHTRRLGAGDPPRTRVLLWHLSQLGLSEGEARNQLSRYDLRVRAVLQRVHYERTVRQGLDARGRPIRSWRAWVLKALEEEWVFEEPEYLEWLERQKARLSVRPAERPEVALQPVPGVTANSEPAGGSLDLADDIWGETLAALLKGGGGPLSLNALRVLAGCWLLEVSESEVRVGAKDAGTATVVEQLYARHLAPALSERLGRTVRLRAVVEEAGESSP